MIRFILTLVMEDFDHQDDIKARFELATASGSGEIVADIMRRYANEIEKAPSILEGFEAKKARRLKVRERGAVTSSQFFQDVIDGRRTPEEFEALLLNEARQAAKEEYPDSDEAELDKVIAELRNEPTFIEAINLAKRASGMRAEVKVKKMKELA